jgi:hypothetical protein
MRAATVDPDLEAFMRDTREGPRRGKANGHAGTDAEAFARFFQFPWEFPEPQPPTLVKGLLGHGEEFMVYGPPEAGKSFFMVDLGCSLASGQNWRGRAVERGLVAYLAGERSGSIKNRVLSWALRNGVDLRDLPVAVLGTSINLMDLGSGESDALVAAIKEASRMVGLPAVAIIGDTVHSLSPGSREDNHSFGVLTGQCRRIRDALGQERPPALGYVHHTGKDEDKGPRGGNSLTGSVGVQMSISVRLGKYRIVEVDKGNDLAGEKPHVEPFVIEDVTLRHSEDGTPVKVGVHVAIPMAEVPNPPDHELRRIAEKMHREGATQRSIAKAVNKSVGWVNKLLKVDGNQDPSRDSP